jgi:hypothetical protein
MEIATLKILFRGMRCRGLDPVTGGGPLDKIGKMP